MFIHSIVYCLALMTTHIEFFFYFKFQLIYGFKKLNHSPDINSMFAKLFSSSHRP